MERKLAVTTFLDQDEWLTKSRDNDSQNNLSKDTAKSNTASNEVNVKVPTFDCCTEATNSNFGSNTPIIQDEHNDVNNHDEPQSLPNDVIIELPPHDEINTQIIQVEHNDVNTHENNSQEELPPQSLPDDVLIELPHPDHEITS
ncbi:hypothetical protein Q3G72_002206 [Acer saccharum]|nr:hypothetical protein Q3G72_002206 [Acer saccharum]